MDCVGRNWPLAGPAQTPRSIDAPTHKPPASQRHRPRLREHSHSSSVFTGVCCSSRSSTSAKDRAGGRGDGSGEWESSQVVSGDAVRQSPGSTPLGRSILTRRVWRRLRRSSATRRRDASARDGFLSRRVWRRGCGCARCASETAGGVPRARGRRVYSEADPGGYYLSALGGRGRTLRLRRANGGGRRCLPSNRVPPARRPCRSEHFAAEPRRVRVGEPEFGCEGNVPSTHHRSAKGPVVRLDTHNNRRKGPGPIGSHRGSHLHNTGRRPRGRSRPGGALRAGRRSGGRAS